MCRPSRGSGGAQPWVQLAAAEWELVLGLWLLSGSYLRGAWVAALGTFLAFAGVSGYLGSIGVASCGCFGTIHASPWHAFAVDVAAVVLLCACRPWRDEASAESMHRPAGAALQWAGGVAVLLVALTVAATAIYGSPGAALAHLRSELLTAADPYLDFGSGKPGESLEATATIRNFTGRPVRLVGGTSDCSCTVLRDLPVTIAPGGSAAVAVRLDIPPARGGRLTRTVFLRTDDPAQPVVRFAIGCRVE